MELIVEAKRDTRLSQRVKDRERRVKDRTVRPAHYGGVIALHDPPTANF